MGKTCPQAKTLWRWKHRKSSNIITMTQKYLLLHGLGLYTTRHIYSKIKPHLFLRKRFTLALNIFQSLFGFCRHCCRWAFLRLVDFTALPNTSVHQLHTSLSSWDLLRKPNQLNSLYSIKIYLKMQLNIELEYCFLYIKINFYENIYEYE